MQLHLRANDYQEPWSIGFQSYLSDYEYFGTTLFVGIACRIAILAEEHVALLDTGAQWCVCSTDVADSARMEPLGEGPPEILSTRFGAIDGVLHRTEFVFLSDDGDNIAIEATFFVSDEWYGPPVIGWKGCLERIRFALDPGKELLFFGIF